MLRRRVHAQKLVVVSLMPMSMGSFPAFAHFLDHVSDVLLVGRHGGLVVLVEFRVEMWLGLKMLGLGLGFITVIGIVKGSKLGNGRVLGVESRLTVKHLLEGVGCL